ncbi:unnamed protein product [Choristocarpus tenellus]
MRGLVSGMQALVVCTSPPASWMCRPLFCPASSGIHVIPCQKNCISRHSFALCQTQHKDHQTLHQFNNPVKNNWDVEQVSSSSGAELVQGLSLWVHSIFSGWFLSATALHLFIPTFLAPSAGQMIVRLSHTPALLYLAVNNIINVGNDEENCYRARLRVGIGIWAIFHLIATLMEPLVPSRIGRLYQAYLDVMMALVSLRGLPVTAEVSWEKAYSRVLTWMQNIGSWGKTLAQRFSRRTRLLPCDTGSDESVEGSSKSLFHFLAIAFEAQAWISLLFPGVVVALLFHGLDPFTADFCRAGVRGNAGSLAFQAFICRELERAAHARETERLPWILRTSVAVTALIQLLVIRSFATSAGLSVFGQVISQTLPDSSHNMFHYGQVQVTCLDFISS